MRYRNLTLTLIVTLALVTASASVHAQNCASKMSFQTRPIPLGVSGGNINSEANGDCWGGTLGSLVQDQNSNQFILSNNHVLANVNEAKLGEEIVQPALVDDKCARNQANVVATLSKKIQIKFGGAQNFVDAAIAGVRPGQVGADILNIGGIASSTVAPMVGMAVQKMGRTTCLTTGTISAVKVNVMGINYGKGRKAKFKNQIKIKLENFSQRGDSGSLVVTTEPCPHAVGLLFGGLEDPYGNSIATFVNPINPVLTRLNVSIVGTCSAAVSAQPDEALANVAVAPDLVDSAAAVRDRHEADFMKIPGVFGTGIGVGDTPGQPAIEVYAKKLTPQARAVASQYAEGLQIRIIEEPGQLMAY